MALRLLPRDAVHGWTPYAWLIYLGFYLMHPAIGQAGALEWGRTAALTGLFLVFYFRGYWVDEGQAVAPALGILGVALLAAPGNPGAACFPIYAAGAFGQSQRGRAALRWIAVVLVTVVLQSWWFDLPILYWAIALAFSTLVGGICFHYAELSRNRRALEASQEEVERLATQAERERIARDLHDLLGHTLSLITLKSELAARLAASDPERAAGEMRQVEEISRRALSEVRAAVTGYRLGSLAEELARADSTLRAAGIELVRQDRAVQLPEEQSQIFSFVLREALTNVLRHSRATTCTVELRGDDQGWLLTVSDDGIGGGREGSGLRGMRERLQAAGGSLVRSLEGGTRLVARLPAEPRAAHGEAS
ncbi:MAG: sensor histidine kinase [Acidobacteriota bacterium]